MAEKTPSGPVCGRLGQNEAYGVVDVCGQPEGHQTAGHGTPHVGRYHGMKWVDRPEYGTGKIRIIDPGDVMGAANREELPHQRKGGSEPKRAPAERQPAPGFRVGTRTRRPHHPEGWFPQRSAPAFSEEEAERRRKKNRKE